MSKNKKHKEFVMPVEKAFAEGIISEEAVEAAKDIFDEPIVVTETKQEENKPAVYTIAKAGTVTNCFKLNIRKEPTKDSEILQVISEGDEVEILDESTANGWLPVLLSDGTKGYTMRDYIN